MGRAALHPPDIHQDPHRDLALAQDEVYPLVALMDNSSGYAYLGLGTAPGTVVRLNLRSDLAVNAAAVPANQAALVQAHGRSVEVFAGEVQERARLCVYAPCNQQRRQDRPHRRHELRDLPQRHHLRRAVGAVEVRVRGSVTREVLGIPARYHRICITPIGVPDGWPDPKPKKKLEELISYETL